jgi:hypothetical protein
LLRCGRAGELPIVGGARSARACGEQKHTSDFSKRHDMILHEFRAATYGRE